MPRVHRHYIPGCIWHITHRCHKQEFLLKFKKDRMRWGYWLFEAKKCYGLCVLNYIATSNHIHLLVVDTGSDVIPRSLQFIAGRVAQEYNQRKQRKGAFWEDRCHATAVESGERLAKCLVYIDLNMVRAGVVHHPSDYSVAGYNEIQDSPKRYRIIDIPKLQALFALADKAFFREEYRNEKHSGANQLPSAVIPLFTTSNTNWAIEQKDELLPAKMKQRSSCRSRIWLTMPISLAKRVV